MQEHKNELVCRLSQVHPIEHWPKYRTCMEYSDKLILPYSILLLIRRTHHPLPPLFKVWSNRSSEFLVLGVLNFAAEENHGFFPIWTIKHLNIDKFCNSEVSLELLPVSKNNLCPFPAVRRIDVFVESFVDYEQCKKAITAYSTLTKNEWKKVMINEQVHKVYILGLYPKNRCLVKDALFDLNLKTLMSKGVSSREPLPKKKDRRILSLDRTRTKFLEMMKTRFVEPGPNLDCLQSIPTCYRREDAFRYSAYNWSHSTQMGEKREKQKERKGAESLELQPWGNDEGGRVHSSQTPPMPMLKPLMFPNGHLKEIVRYGCMRN